MVEDEGGFVVPQEYKNNLLEWLRLTTDEHGQKAVTRLIVIRSRFERFGAHNEECAEYVLSVLDYIMGHAQDDPTSDWIIKQPP